MVLKRLKKYTPQLLSSGKAFYHTACQKSIVNTSKLNRLKKRVENTGSTVAKRGRPVLSSAELAQNEEPLEELPVRSLRCSGVIFEKDKCVICQKEGGQLHKVEYTSTGNSMLEIAQQLDNQELLLRLNHVPNAADAVANDVQYHLLCWVNLKRNASKLTSNYHVEYQEMKDPNKIVADIEVVNIAGKMIQNQECVDMNTLNSTYNNLFGNPTEHQVNHKRYLKQLLTENVKNIVFSRPKARRDSEVICSNSFKENALDCFRNLPDEFTALFEAASIVRRDILKKPKWSFTGSFNDFEIPETLTTLLRWIIIGPKLKVDLSPKKKESVDVAVRNIGEIMCNL